MADEIMQAKRSRNQKREFAFLFSSMPDSTDPEIDGSQEEGTYDGNNAGTT